MEAIKNWWMPKWNSFAEKHPGAAKWVREGGLFFLFSNMVTVWQYISPPPSACGRSGISTPRSPCPNPAYLRYGGLRPVLRQDGTGLPRPWPGRLAVSEHRL